MGNGRNTAVRERRSERKRRRRFVSRLFMLILTALVLIELFRTRSIEKKLEEIEKLLQENGIAWEGDIGAEENISVVTTVAGIGSVEVERPVERTWKETLQKLKELGRKNPTIEKIYKNSFDYPETMLTALANNPEMADFVAGYPDSGGGVTGGINEQEKEQSFPLFLQWDSRWGYQDYGEDNIGLAGCGPTCLSMVMYYLTRDESFTPDRIAGYSMENGYYVEGTGTAWALLSDFPRQYGISVTELGAAEETLKAELERGGILICAMRKGDFTLSGHFIVIYGYEDGKFLVNDPNCVARSRGWSFAQISGQIKNIWSYQKERTV